MVEVNKPRKKRLLLGCLGLMLLLLSIVLSFQLYFLNRIYPAVYVAGVNLGGMTAQQANLALSRALGERLVSPLKVTYEEQDLEIDLRGYPGPFEIDKALTQAFLYGRSKFYASPVSINLQLGVDQKLQDKINQIAQSIDQAPIEAQIRVLDGQVNVSPSQDGLVLDAHALKQMAAGYINTGVQAQTLLPVTTVSPNLSYEEALLVKKVLDKVKEKPISLTYESRSWVFNFYDVMAMVDLENTGREGKIVLEGKKVEEYLSAIAAEVDREVEEPLLKFNPQAAGGEGRVTEFRPPQDGLKLSKGAAAGQILEMLDALSGQDQAVAPEPIALEVEVVAPKNKLSSELGIRHLLGRGTSYFKGSIENRMFNIRLAASRINGVLVPPGEEFSFNENVGDISAASGYKQAYVIKSGRTVLDDGGGVCQVSTTVFRAALNGGLPIVARTAHAYRVGYYEQGFAPGLDATIFSPSVDFKFKNDTSAHILVQAYTIGTALYVDLYGTSDGRTVELSQPKVSNVTPPPPQIRQDDPTLPKGTIKQVDWAAEGAKVVFTRKVTRSGEELISESFVSNYRPWQAVFLVGTKE